MFGTLLIPNSVSHYYSNYFNTYEPTMFLFEYRMYFCWDLCLWLAELAHMSSSWPITGRGRSKSTYVAQTQNIVHWLQQLHTLQQRYSSPSLLHRNQNANGIYYKFNQGLLNNFRGLRIFNIPNRSWQGKLPCFNSYNQQRRQYCSCKLMMTTAKC